MQDQSTPGLGLSKQAPIGKNSFPNKHQNCFAGPCRHHAENLLYLGKNQSIRRIPDVSSWLRETLDFPENKSMSLILVSDI